MTEAFKAKLGFNKPEEIADDDNDEYSSDLGADASIYNLTALNNSYCFEAFMKENFCKDALGDASTPLKQPLLKSLSAEGIQVTLQSVSGVCCIVYEKEKFSGYAWLCTDVSMDYTSNFCCHCSFLKIQHY